MPDTQTRATLSVCIITLNEERNLPRCLASVAGLADQIVVVDSCSDDRTREIAAAANAEVLTQAFLGYEKQKQLALERATGDWALCLDADEWLDETARKSLALVLESPVPPEIEGFTLNRLPLYLGRWIHHSGWSPDWKLRLVRRGCGRWTGGVVHERLEVKGRTRRLKGRLRHFPYRDLSAHVRANDHYTNLIAGRPDRVSAVRALFGMLLEPSLVFLHKFVIQGGFRDGLRGFVCCYITSFYFFLRYAKIWERRYARVHAAAGGDPAGDLTSPHTPDTASRP